MDIKQQATKAAKVPSRRPAETSTLVAGAVAYFVSRIFHLTAEDTAMLIPLVGALPSAITWLVVALKGD